MASTRAFVRPVSPGPSAPYLRGRVWVAALVLYGILAILEPYDLLSPISGWGLQEHRAEIGAALDTIEGGNLLRRVGVLALLLYGVVSIWVSRGGRRRYRLAIAVPAAALLLLALASPLWSDVPAITTRKVFVLCSLVLTVFGLVRCWDLETTVRAALVLSGATILLGAATEVVLGTMHPLNADFRFRGSIHPNSMALYCTLFVISSVVLAKRFTGRRSVLMAVISGIGMGMLLLTKSRGSLFGLCAALAVVAMFSLSHRAVLLGASAIGVGILAALIFIPDLVGHAQSWATLGRSTTYDLMDMTGRTDLFRSLLPYIGDRPFLGYGYDSFWGPVHILEIARSQGWIIGSSHDQFIGMLLDLGAVGCVLFLVLLASSLWTSVANVRRDRSAVSLFPVAVLVWSYVNMITFGFWFETTIPSFFGLLVVARLAVREPLSPAVRHRAWGRMPSRETIVSQGMGIAARAGGVE